MWVSGQLAMTVNFSERPQNGDPLATKQGARGTHNTCCKGWRISLTADYNSDNQG